MVSKKKVKPAEITKEKSEKLVEIVNTHPEIIFPAMKEKRVVSTDINYFGIKQKMKEIGFDFFNYVKPKKSDIKSKFWHNTKKLIYDNIIFYLIDRKDWLSYCNLWNKYINGGKINGRKYS